MQLPTRLAVALTTAITALMALSAEVTMSHPMHVLCVIAGGFVLGLIVRPAEAGTLPTAALEGPPPVPASVIGEQQI